MKVFRKLFLLFLSLLLITGCSITTDEVNSNSNSQKELNEKNDTKTIKMGTKEYFNLIKESLLKVQDESNNLKLTEYRTRSVTYLIASFYTNKYLDDATMNKEIKNAMKILYDNFSINKYKKGGLFSYDYEYLNISFYNRDSAKSRDYTEYKFIQIDFSTISKYSNFEEFYKSKMNKKIYIND